MKVITINKAKKILLVSGQTIRNWEKNKKLIPCKKSANGYRYYYEQDIFDLLKKQEKIIIGYCRVSSNKQKDDLNRQIENVSKYMIARGYQFEIITDIGSGINYTKNGLTELINKISSKKVSKVVILYKDRLVRFGFELLEQFFKIYDCQIEIIDNTERTEEQELVEDLIQIITVFSCRLQGKRSKKTKDLINSLKQND